MEVNDCAPAVDAHDSSNARTEAARNMPKLLGMVKREKYDRSRAAAMTIIGRPRGRDRASRAQRVERGRQQAGVPMKLTFAILIAATLGWASLATAQGPMSYGSPITAETAKKIAAPAVAEARKNQWAMAVAIVDTAGDLVYFERMDDTQVGSIDVAIDKARSAVRFKRAT